MQSLDQRVAYLEGRMEEQSTSMNDLRTDLRGFRADVTREFSEFRAEMREFRSEMARQFAEVNTRFNAQDGKIDRHFMWIMGTQFAVLLSIIGAMIGAYLKSG